MAKITPSSLITAIQGRFNGDTFQLWRGAVVRRRTPKPRGGPSVAQATFRGIASDIAGKWAALSDAARADWDTYAGLLPTEMSGFNAFFARNTALLLADNPALVYSGTAPGSYSPPPTPSPLSVLWMAGSESFCVAWTAPSLGTQYCQVYTAHGVGFSVSKFPSISLSKTIVSTAQETTVSGAGYLAGSSVVFRVRGIDSLGQLSSFSESVVCVRS